MQTVVASDAASANMVCFIIEDCMQLAMGGVFRLYPEVMPTIHVGDIGIHVDG